MKFDSAQIAKRALSVTAASCSPLAAEAIPPRSGHSQRWNHTRGADRHAGMRLRRSQRHRGKSTCSSERVGWRQLGGLVRDRGESGQTSESVDVDQWSARRTGQHPLEAGHYQQLRLALSNNTPAAPFANSVVPTGGTETPLDTPSAQQSGLKMNANITVAANQLADVVLDFKACNSVVATGQTNRYILKPVLSILPRVTTGLAVEGYVAGAIASGSTSVSLQQDGVVARATVPDANGKFLLSPVPAAGTYDLVITAAGRANSVVTGVPVTTTGKTVVNASTAPIDPPTSIARNASGNRNHHRVRHDP